MPKLSPSQEAAVKAALDPSIPLVFITGRAGTGKSEVIKAIRAAAPKGMALCAPTGMAASNIGGATIHGTFKLKPEFLDPDSRDVSRVDIAAALKLLGLDEISMTRADVLDRINASLQYSLANDRLFGGVKVVMVGDCWQLSPVVTQDERSIFEMRYASPWWFHARCLQGVKIHYCQLDEVFRQNDAGFLDLLDKARTGDVPQSWIDRLNARCHRGYGVPDDTLVLTSTRKATESINALRLSQIDSPTVTLTAIREGSYLHEKEDALPVPPRLELKVGAKVVVCRNADGLSNGTRAVVVSVTEGVVMIQPEGSKSVAAVTPYVWQKISYKVQGKSIESHVTGSYSQVPLLLGWAMTIHKAQGATLDRACVDLGSGSFASGQAYVALSRVRSLDGLTLRRPIKASDFMRDEDVAYFMSKFNGNGDYYVSLPDEEDVEA